MVLETFESLFWVGAGFIPKSHIMQMSYNNRNNKQELKQTENHSIKKDTIIMRYLLSLKNKERKIRTCKQ